MPSLLSPPPSPPAPLAPRRKRWTRTECAALESMGLMDQQHVELVQGELIDKMGKNNPHLFSLALVAMWMRRVFGELFVLTEAPIDVAPEDNPASEPEPDVIAMRYEFGHARSATRRPEDLRLVVEVSDSGLMFDLTTKASLYARAAIVEYWVLDVIGRRLIVHRNPAAEKYETVVVYGENESVAPLAAPHAEFRAAEAFPVTDS